MGKIYRVLVIEQGPDTRWESGRPSDRVLFEAAGPDAGRLLAYAPGEVEAALTVAGYAAMSQKVSGVLVDTEALGEALATGGVVSVGPGQLVPAVGVAEVASAAGNEQPVDEPAAPKRKRRTKAEIEADRAAEALAAQQQASAAPVEGGPAPQAPAAAEPAPDQQPATPAAPPTAPYNPFA
jgi:hypothetical protein